MRPIKLTLKNLGPYANQTIHFDRLQNAPTFLISGPTGSGKTTIFDAITFALYGNGSSDDRNVESMRSDFAGPDQPTVVELTFEHEGLVYEIIRKPKQLLNKKRGSGQKEYGSEGQLDIYKHDHQIDEIKRLREINLKIESVLQISREQFVQIILLPQGDFQRFLLAPSSEKENVLRKIFKTQLYQRWADFLNDMRKNHKQQYQDWQNDIQKDLQSVEWQPDFKPDDDLNQDQLIKRLKQQQQAAKQKLTKLKRQLATLRTQSEHARQHFEQAQKLNQQIDELDQSKQQLSALNEQAATYDQMENHIQLLKWVQPLNNNYVQMEKSQQKINTLQQQITDINEHLKTVRQNQAESQKQQQRLNQAQPEQQRRLDQVAVLKKERPAFAELQAENKKLSNASNKLATADEQQRTLKQRIDQLKQNDQELQNNLKQLPQVQSNIYQTQHLVDNLKQGLQDEKQLLYWQSQIKDLRHQIKSNQTDVKTVQQKVEQKQQTANDLHNQQLQGQIVNLVKQLKPGTACPICGSKQHPLPATVDELIPVSESEVKAANDDLKQAQNDLARLNTTIKERQNQLKQFNQQLHDGFQALLKKLKSQKITIKTKKVAAISEILQRHLDDNRQQLDQWNHQQDELQAQQIQHDQNQSKLNDLQNDFEKGQTEVQNQQNGVNLIQGRLADLNHHLPTGFDNVDALDDQLKNLRQAINDFEQIQEDNQAGVNKNAKQLASLSADQKNTEQQIKTAQTDYQTQQSELTKAINDQKAVADWDAFLKLVNSLDQLDSEQQQLSAYQKQVQTATANINAQQKAIGDHHQVDLTSEHQHLDQLAQELNQFETDYETKTKIVTINDATLQRIQDNVKRIQTYASRMNQLSALVDVVTGNNTAKLGLERYVLRAELIRILTTANQHLSELSSGRYAFMLHDTAGSYQKDTGLEVDVYDDDVGKKRSVHTLSGGEKFIAALSLALALGEVIQEESGGIHIDTLFIDEGFGSLDQESLNVAMNTLHQLNDQHRMIGIISHVESLQQQIPYQIRVHKHPDGKSTAKIITPDNIR